MDSNINMHSGTKMCHPLLHVPIGDPNIRGKGVLRWWCGCQNGKAR